MPALQSLYLWLLAIHPVAPAVLLTLTVWATIYAVRRWLPSLWLPLTKWPTADGPVSIAIQGLPAVIMGAAMGAVTLGHDPWGAVKGASAGLLAPFVHHLLKLAPVPYQGLLRDTAKQAAAKLDAWEEAKRKSEAAKKLTKVALLLLALLVLGCVKQPPIPPSSEPAYQACLRAARNTFDARADQQCPPDEVQWLECDHRASLMAQYTADQAACRG